MIPGDGPNPSLTKRVQHGDEAEPETPHQRGICVVQKRVARGAGERLRMCTLKRAIAVPG
jgi:hypothetical protein